MEIKALPRRPNLEQYKKQAKDLLKGYKSDDPGSIRRIVEHHPRFQSPPPAHHTATRPTLTDAQLVLAREHGFASWTKFSSRIEALRREHSALLRTNPEAAFIEAACVPLDARHGSGTLESANAILATHPEVAASSVYTAAILGDESGVRRFLALDANNATARGGLHNWDALTYLCFSRYLHLDPVRSAGLVRTATALLDAGANPNTGWHEEEHEPKSMWESAIYGAAGFAHHAELTRLLLERGADPNDDETPYHAAESYDLGPVKALVESGRLTAESLTTILLRKADWHDFKGFRYLLDQGADPNRMTLWKHTAFQFALRRDNELEIIDLLLDRGADPALANQRDGRSGAAMAARRGRGDVLNSLDRRGTPYDLQPLDRLIAACATGDGDAIQSMVASSPHLVRELIADGGTLLAEFSGNGNEEGVTRLLSLGVNVAARYKEGDNYFDIAKDSTALHCAAWRMRHPTVEVLIQHGAPVDALDAQGRTPLAFAVRACVDSYWAARRSPESVRMLLEAGASPKSVAYPCGYAEVDELLLQFRKIQA